MSKMNKFYYLTLVLGLIFLNFDIFEKFIFLRFLGRGLQFRTEGIRFISVD